MEFKAKTSFGSFRVSVNNDIKIDFDTRERKVIGKLITVGGKNSCVTLNAPDSSETSHLMSVKRTDGGCELDGKEISGEKTVSMVNLAFTILKENCPHIKYITLEDRSDIPCKLKNGSIVGISLASHQILFHQATWYERHFNAKLINQELRKMYEEGKANFKNKPASFDFNNPDLNETLGPILHKSQSWEDFFKVINTLPNKCEVIFLWYSKALKEIFNNVGFDRQDWIIDVAGLTNIEYLRVQIGGTRKSKTRKQEKKSPFLDHISYDDSINYKFKIIETNPLRIQASFPKHPLTQSPQILYEPIN